jgi:hypothetical protein
MTLTFVAGLMLLGLAAPASAAEKKSDRAALKPLHDLIGDWKCTSDPRSSRDREFWQETAAWKWQFKGETAWLRADVKKGRYYTKFELRPAKDGYELKAWPVDAKEPVVFKGTLEKKRLTFERPMGKGAERLVFSLLHFNRYLYSREERPEGHAVFTKKFLVGATKKGVPFADVPKGPECVVSGGLGTSVVRYKGKEYYVCCSGCRDAFIANPEKYIKEYEASKKKKD